MQAPEPPGGHIHPLQATRTRFLSANGPGRLKGRDTSGPDGPVVATGDEWMFLTFRDVATGGERSGTAVVEAFSMFHLFADINAANCSPKTSLSAM